MIYANGEIDIVIGAVPQQYTARFFQKLNEFAAFHKTTVFRR